MSAKSYCGLSSTTLCSGSFSICLASPHVPTARKFFPAATNIHILIPLCLPGYYNLLVCSVKCSLQIHPESKSLTILELEQFICESYSPTAVIEAEKPIPRQDQPGKMKRIYEEGAAAMLF